MSSPDLDRSFVPEISVFSKKKRKMVFTGSGPRFCPRNMRSLEKRSSPDLDRVLVPEGKVFADFRLRLFGSEYSSQAKIFPGWAAPLAPTSRA